LKSPALGEPNTFQVLAVDSVAKPGRKVQVEDAIEFLFTTVIMPHFTILHYNNAGDTVEARAARHTLRKILEYNDTGAPGFDPDVDTIVSNYYFWNVIWTPFVFSSSVTNGVTIYSLTTGTSDGVVGLTVYLSNQGFNLRLNGTNLLIFLDNNAIHHTLTIKNFPYKSTGTSLALKVVFESATVISDIDSGAAGQNATVLVGATGITDPIRPVADWATFVNVTGTGCNPTASIAKDIYRDVDSVRDIDLTLPKLTIETNINLNFHITYFSFLTNCQATEIVWDPEIGIQDYSSAVVFIPSFFLLMMLVILLI